jgi:hypothetical protein
MSDPINNTLDDNQRCHNLYAKTLKLLDDDIVACMGDEPWQISDQGAMSIQILRNQQGRLSREIDDGWYIDPDLMKPTCKI